MKPAGSRLTIPNKAHWTKEEDEQMKTLVQQLGDKSWVVVAEHMPKRTAKQIRERYCNHLRPDLKKVRRNKMSALVLIVYVPQRSVDTRDTGPVDTRGGPSCYDSAQDSRQQLLPDR